jgi:hypothetical protein
MSINNIENIAFNYLTNLTTINADEVNTDVLTKVDPDISDLQFDMLEGIRTNETIQQQIDSIETQIGNIGASYWFSAWDTTTQTNPVANTPRIVTWNTSDPSGNGIVAGPVTGSIKVLNTNTYNIQFSFQLHQTNIIAANVTIWLRKNGTDILASAGEYDVKGNDHLVIAWNYVMVLEANDYIQFVWASNHTSMTLAYQAAQTSPYAHPAIPSVIITVTNVTGEGPAGAQGATGPRGERGPRGYKGDRGPEGPAGDGPVAYSALALAGAADAAVIALGAVVSGQAGTIAGLSTNVAALNTSQGAQDTAIAALQAKTVYQSAEVETTLKTKFSSDVVVRDLSGEGGDAVILSATDNNYFKRQIQCKSINATEQGSVFHSLRAESGSIETNDFMFCDWIETSPARKEGLKILMYDPTGGAEPVKRNSIQLLADGDDVSTLYTVGKQEGFDGPAHIFAYAEDDTTQKRMLLMDKYIHAITANNINLRATGNTNYYRDCGIDIQNISSVSSDLGQMSIRGGIINIGNASQASIINLNGIVNLPAGSSFRVAGLIQQWS